MDQLRSLQGWWARAARGGLTPAGNRNAENLLVLDSPHLTLGFTAEWELIRLDEP